MNCVLGYTHIVPCNASTWGAAARVRCARVGAVRGRAGGGPCASCSDAHNVSRCPCAS